MTKAIEFDFAQKIDKEVPLAKVRETIAAGRFVWLDLDGSDVDQARDLLKSAVPLEEAIIGQCLALTPDTKYDLRTGCLHLVIVGCRIGGGGAIEHDRVDVILGPGYTVTIHRDPVPFMEAVKEVYHDDFVRFAKSPGFLLYEIWDALIDSYESLETEYETRVEDMQHRVLTRFDESVFPEFARLGADLLHIRKVLSPTRSVLDELASRKSAFVSEATQPFLAGMVPRIERILEDVMVYRDVLSNAMNLLVAIGDHKLNKVMQKLTAVSLFFMPLTFITGVYGMNFTHQPEFAWKYGYYLWFWGIVAVILAIVYFITRRMRFL